MVAELVQCFLMLLSVAAGMRSIPATGLIRALGMKRDRIEFMVTHHRQSSLLFNHIANNVNCIADLWASVNEVAAKHCLAICMTKNAATFGISQLLQQFHQFVCIAVNVPDNVVNSQVLFVAANTSHCLAQVSAAYLALQCVIILPAGNPDICGVY